MEKTFEVIRELFVRDLRTTPLETALFLIVVFGFFGLLVLANILRRRKEKKQLSRLHREKWEKLKEKHHLTVEESGLLEKLSVFLKNPEKKYLLISDYQVFQNALSEYGSRNEADGELVGSILTKTDMHTVSGFRQGEQLKRRKSTRHKVQIPAKIAPAEHTTAHIETRMFNLSAGGCKTDNPGQRFHAGDDIKISFLLKGKAYTDVPGEVVRTGPGSKTLHISFGHVKKTHTV